MWRLEFAIDLHGQFVTLNWCIGNPWFLYQLLVATQWPIIENSIWKLLLKNKFVSYPARRRLNEFMRSSFLPKYQLGKIYRDFCPGSLLEGRAEISVIFGWYFGRNDDLINSFWIQLTFTIPLDLSTVCFISKFRFKWSITVETIIKLWVLFSWKMHKISRK